MGAEDLIDRIVHLIDFFRMGMSHPLGCDWGPLCHERAERESLGVTEKRNLGRGTERTGKREEETKDPGDTKSCGVTSSWGFLILLAVRRNRSG